MVFEVCRTSAGGIAQSFVLWGEPKRPAMVLLHGLSGHARMWDAFACAMASRFQVIATDQRGHGDSEWPRPPSYDTADFVRDLRALADIRGNRALHADWPFHGRAQRAGVRGPTSRHDRASGLGRRSADDTPAPGSQGPRRVRSRANRIRHGRRCLRRGATGVSPHLEEGPDAPRPPQPEAARGREVDVETQSRRGPPLGSGRSRGCDPSDTLPHPHRSRRGERSARPGNCRAHGGRDPIRQARERRRLGTFRPHGPAPRNSSGRCGNSCDGQARRRRELPFGR